MEVTLKNVVQNKSLLLSQSASSQFILESFDWGQVKGSVNAVKYINLVGSEPRSTSLESRDINIVMWLVASTPEEMTELKQFMNKFINPLQDLECIYGDYLLTMRPDTSVQYNNTEVRYNNQVLCRCLIQCTSYMPMWELKTKKVVKESGLTGAPLFPMIIPENKGITFGYIPFENITNVENKGDLDAGFILTLEAHTGQVTNPKITNNLTGKSIEVMIDMDLGDIVKISTIPGQKYAKLIRGESETDILRYITKESTMSLTLNTGINDITITAAANALNLKPSLAFSPLWLEVQEVEVY